MAWKSNKSRTQEEACTPTPRRCTGRERQALRMVRGREVTRGHVPTARLSFSPSGGTIPPTPLPAANPSPATHSAQTQTHARVPAGA